MGGWVSGMAIKIPEGAEGTEGHCNEWKKQT